MDSNLVVGIAQRLNRYTLISTKSIHQEKEIKNIVSYGKERSLPTLYIVNYESRSEERRVGKECRSRWSPYH